MIKIIIIIGLLLLNVSYAEITIPKGSGVGVESDDMQDVYSRGNTITLSGNTITNAVCIGDGVTASDTLVCTYVDGVGMAQFVVCDGTRANCGPFRKTVGTLSSTPYTMTAADCGVFLQIATGASQINLLADMTGCLLCVREVNAVATIFEPNGSDTIDVVSYNVENGTALAPAGGASITLGAVAGYAACLIGTSATAITLLPGTLGGVTTP